jgi:deoxyribonuclease-4
VAGGLAAGLRYASDIGAEAIQVFVSNPRSWALPAAGPAHLAREAEVIRDQLAEAGLPVFVHAPYLINVGSADPVIRERSVASMRHSLCRGGAIGARGVVVHPGSAAGGDRDKSMLYARECLLPVLDSIPADGPDLLLEPMAGRASCSAPPPRTWDRTWRCWIGIRGRVCAWTPATRSRPGPTSPPQAARPRP